MKKNLFALGVVLASAFTLTNCTDEIRNPQDGKTPYTIYANASETKTANDGLSTVWVEGDALNVFHAEAGTSEYSANTQFTLTDAETGQFDTEELQGELSPSNDWYVLYPYSSNLKTPASKTKEEGYIYVGHRTNLVQADGLGDTGHLSGSNCPLYGIAKGVSGVDVPSMDMHQLSSVVKVQITNTSGQELAVTSVALTAEEDIVGSYYIDITGEKPAYTSPDAQYKSNTASVTVKGDNTLADGATGDAYIVIKPFTAAAGSKLVLSVNGYEKELILPKASTFHAGKIKTLVFDYDYVTTAKSVTFDFNANEWGLPVSATGTEDKGNITDPIVSGDVTMTATYPENAGSKTRLWNKSGTPELRAYSNSSLSFSVPSGYVITKMTFTGGKISTSLFTPLTGEYASPVWTGSANPVVLNITGTINVSTITIEYDKGEAEAIKTPQELSFPEKSYSVVMGDVFEEPELSGAQTAVTYTSSEEDVATVSSNGTVTVVGVGSTVITATAEADETYASASASYTLNVNPAPSDEVLSLPWTEDFSGNLDKYTVGNGGTATKIYNENLAKGAAAPELLISKSNGFLSAEIATGGYTGALTLTFKSNYPARIEVTSNTSGVEISKNSDTEYIVNVTKAVETINITLTNVQSSNTRIDDISLVKGGDIPGGGEPDPEPEPEPDPTPGAPTSLTTVTVAEFLAASESTDTWYKLTGEIVSIASTTYGNFTIDDGTASVYIYGMTSEWVGSNDQSFASLGLKVGDTVTLGTLRTSYNGTAQGGGKTIPAYYISHVEGETPEPPATGSEFSSNVTFGTVSSAYTDGLANVNGVSGVSTLKLGTSNKYGEGTITVPAGTTEISYYAVGWKANPSKLEFSMDGTVLKTQEIAANDGATGSATYTMTVSDSDKYTLSLSSALTSETKITIKTVETGYRAIIFAVQAN